MKNLRSFLSLGIILMLAGCIPVATAPPNKDPDTPNAEITSPLTEENVMIRLTTPSPNQEITSPLTIIGEARGPWFFEASFPVMLTNWDGLIIAQGIATAQGNWMTEEFVPFTAELTFDKPTYKNNGSLILQKDNPSGLPENDGALEIPVLFN